MAAMIDLEWGTGGQSTAELVSTHHAEVDGEAVAAVEAWLAEPGPAAVPESSEEPPLCRHGEMGCHGCDCSPPPPAVPEAPADGPGAEERLPLVAPSEDAVDPGDPWGLNRA